MSKINCKCGAQLSDVSATTTNGYFVSEGFIEAADFEAENWADAIVEKCRHVWFCYECERVWISDDGGWTGKWYAPADEAE